MESFHSRKMLSGNSVKWSLSIALGFLLISNFQIIHTQPVFSHKHGFYSTPFNLTISPLTAGTHVYFTTDGSAPSLINGTLYTTPLYIDTLSVVRAVEIKDNSAGKIATSTYLFLDDIIRQPNNPEGYPSTWGPYTGITGTAKADYEMDPELMAVTGFPDSVKAGLLDLPVISLVTDKGYLFSKSQDPVTGGIYIYTGPPLTNTTNGIGYGWERPVSFEYFDAQNSVSLQVDCALELQGNHGRRAEKSPKHSFRLTFKTAYGPAKLNYPLFGADADSVYNTIILRAGFGNTWVHWSYSEREMAQYLRDRWTKDTHLDMGHSSSHGFYVHLFINGLYWGIYNPSERMDKDFAVMYLGGKEEDYDVIKDYAEVADGNINAWNTMMSLANSGLSTAETYQRIQGNFPDGASNPKIEPMVNMVSLADYMLLNFYGGNWDWDHHNWVAIRNRADPFRGFEFFCWDGEHMVEGVNANILTKNNNNCPSRVFQKLRENEDFRRLFADRIQKHCFNGGALTAVSAAERWTWRANQIDKAINAEAARWGDYRRDVHPWQTGPYGLYTKESYWLPQMDFILNTYFPNRTNSFISSLRNAGLFPAIDAPVFSLSENKKLAISAAQGVIYYTTDGTDPVIWDPVPAISPLAVHYTGQVTLEESVHIKARCYSGGTWSATTEEYFTFPSDFQDIKITEINYHPLDMGVDDNQELEFIELKNTGTSTLNMRGLRFIDGIDFVFREDMPLRPQEFIVLASNSRFFRDRYGFWPYATFDGQLNDAGEIIVLISSAKDTICSFEYSDDSAWPETPDGDGYSLVPTDFNPANDQNDPEFWRASNNIGGSPGADDKWIPEGKSSDLLTVFPNFPNPFTVSTTLQYKLKAYAHLTITIIDATGKPITTLEDRDKFAGSYQVVWNGTSSENRIAAAGIYFYRIYASNSNGSSMLTCKMLKIR
ncbi:MAG: chitobiase/beta-hexosaminidase C-terminal domain-containing protein [Bacteroidia bacterium]|nr:chitobiase/beta-hexosaminidase C-terminal domain-containing protein [Bacteroidia bacterium]